jgi:hypothetical protein
MAAYLASIGSDPRAVQQRRPPVLGAGQAGLPESRGTQNAGGDQAKSSLAAKPRRPSDSVEVAVGLESDVESVPPSAGVPPERQPLEPFEE